jgi:DNA-binding IclR family transcriptional regulator
MRVLRLLESNQGETFSPNAIAQRVGCTKRTAQIVLGELKREGKAFTRRDFSSPGCVYVWGRVAV